MAQLKGGKKTFTHITWNCTSQKKFVPRSACFRALKTLGTETPANHDVSFLLHCNNNQEYFSSTCYERSKWSALYQRSWAWFCLFPCLLLATLLPPLWIGQQLHIIPLCERVKYWWRTYWLYSYENQYYFQSPVRSFTCLTNRPHKSSTLKMGPPTVSQACTSPRNEKNNLRSKIFFSCLHRVSS